MKITVNKEVLLSKFLTPISRVAERCVISIFKDRIQALVTTADTNPILFANVITTSDIGTETEVTLNVPNVKKLRTMLNCITSNDIELEVNSNNVEYKSLNMKFKYHLLEDGVIEKSPVHPDKIKALTFDTDFVLDSATTSEIMKGASFASESSKIYFYTKDDIVYAEMTDKEIANMDSVSYMVTDTYNGVDVKKPILIDLEIFKMFSGMKDDMITKINTQNRVVMFKFEGNDYTLQYIVSPLTK